jgi:hypothetical protein
MRLAMLRRRLPRAALGAAAFLAGCSVTTVTFEREGETPAGPPAARPRDLPIYTATAPPPAPYVTIGTIKALRGLEQLRGLTGPVRRDEMLALLKKKAAGEGAQGLMDVDVRERHVSLKLGGEGIRPEVRALAEYGCDVIHYMEATAQAIVFTTPSAPR